MSGPVQANHALVSGPAGGGKTTLARQLHAEHPGPSVFLTIKGEDEEAAPTRDPPRRVYRPGAEYPADRRRAREWARDHPEEVQVIVDEAQRAPSFGDGDGPLADGLHEDRSGRVKWVVLTQNPMDLRTDDRGYGPVQQIPYWAFAGAARTWHVGFFNANNMSDMPPHLPTEPFEYVVLRPVASLSPEERIVYRGRTKEEYA